MTVPMEPPFPLSPIHLLRNVSPCHISTLPSPSTSTTNSTATDPIPTEVVVTKFSNRVVVQVSQCAGKVGSVHLCCIERGIVSEVRTLVGKRDSLTSIYASEIANIAIKATKTDSIVMLALKRLPSDSDSEDIVSPSDQRVFEGVLDMVYEAFGIQRNSVLDL